MIDLAGKVAVVTGGTKGIGRAIAEALVAAGADVCIAARTERDVESVAAQLANKSKSGRTLGVAADVGRYEDCRALINYTVDRFGRLDILINNAGIGGFKKVTELEPERWDAVIQTNLSSLFYCSHEALPHLRQAGESWIINIGSLAGKNAFPGGVAYNASKFGLIGFSEALMQEVRQDDIRVSYIMPGSVATEFNGSPDHSAWKIQPEDIAELVMDLLQMNPRTLPSRIEVRPSKPPAK